MCDDQDKGPEKKNNRQIKEGFCHKCKLLQPTVQIRNSLFCKTCFQDSVVHRFRTNLFKLKPLNNPRVLLAYSGGISSTCLLQVMTEFSRIDLQFEKRRPRYPFVHVCHVDQSVLFNNHQLVKDLEEMVLTKGLPFSSVPLESLFESNSVTLHSNLISKDSSSLTPQQKLKKALDSSSSYSSKEDLIDTFTIQVLEQEATRLGCNMILFGDTATLLAIKTISNTSKGRGMSLPSELALEYLNPLTGIKRVKPLRDILAKEVGIFNQYRSLVSFSHPRITTGMSKKTSIERMTADFIIGLEVEFPSTVSTIARTAFKIPSTVSTDSTYCVICKRPVDSKSGFSKIDSTMSSANNCTDCDNHCTDCDTKESINVDSLICYGCKNIVLEMKKSSKDGMLPQSAWDMALNQVNQQKMKETISEYLLDDV